MNSLNLKFVPKKKPDFSKTTSRSVMLGAILGLAAVTLLYMIGYYEAQGHKSAINDLKPKYDELYEIISKPGYDISLNDSVLTINAAHYDLNKVNTELNDLADVVSTKYYYTKVGSSLVFYTSVTITVDTLEEAGLTKALMKELKWVNNITEQNDFKFENNKYTVSYLLALKMGELKYEKN